MVVLLPRSALIVGVLGSVLMLQGCAGIGLTLLGIGGGTAASAGVNHTLGGIAYKTFAAPADEVHAAARNALQAMAMPIDKDQPGEAGGHVLAARAADREIDIAIETITPRTTRLRVVATEDVIFKDSSTATEIIMQTAQALDDLQATKARLAAARAIPARTAIKKSTR